MTQSIKRIVVSLDAASEPGPAIDTAARLAARWHVPLHGVFIEDEELIDLAGLPFARQVTLATGRGPLTKDQIEDHFRAFAERSRRELTAAAARHGIQSSFEVVRGAPAAAVLGGENDFVVAAATTRPVGDHFRVASRWWSLTAIITRPLLLAKCDWKTGGSVFALLRGRGPQSARMLEMAAQIAAISRAVLTVAGPPDLTGADDFEGWLSGLLEGHSVSLQTELAATDPATLRQRILELDCLLLVIEGGEGEPDELRELVEPMACDVLLVH